MRSDRFKDKAEFYRKLCNYLKEARLKSGLSQAQIAEAINMSRYYVIKVEKGGSKPGTKTILTWVKICGITIDEFCREFLGMERTPEILFTKTPTVELDILKRQNDLILAFSAIARKMENAILEAKKNQTS